MKRKILVGLEVLILVVLVATVLILGKKSPENENVTSLELGQGLFLTELENKSGVYVEDGSDVQIDNVASFVIENRTDKTLQLAQIHLSVEGEQYDFSVTTLPPKEKAFVQEMNKKVLPEEYTDISAEMEYVVFFMEEPSLKEEVFALEEAENGITVKNISGTDIRGPIYIYYKTLGDGMYEGGITYRVLVESLAKDEVYQAQAMHFYSDRSKVMFVEYAQ